MITKKKQQRILSLFKRKTKDARKIAEIIEVPRRHVMRFLENQGLRYYSDGSYD